jgi:hypothetical protein
MATGAQPVPGMKKYQIKGILISISFIIPGWFLGGELRLLFFVGIVLFVAVAIVSYGIESAIKNARGKRG